jgi:transketolase
MSEKLSGKELASLREFADKIRMYTLYSIGNLGVGHVGGSMSIVEILAYLYGHEMNVDPKNPRKEDRDLLVLSKGHSGPALYSTLALLGFFPESWLKTLNVGGTSLPSHADRNRTPGIDMSTGSLGQGLSVACGAAYGSKVKGLDKQRVFAIIGDGETNEGQNFEAAMFAAHMKLDNLIAATDCNRLQLDGTIDDISGLNPDKLEAMWSSFGWETCQADGHDLESIHRAYSSCMERNGKPKMIIMNTIKAKGVPSLENNVGSHNAPLALDTVKEIYNGEVPAWLK